MPAKTEFSKILMPKKQTGGTNFTIPNKNFPNSIKHSRTLQAQPSFSSTVKALNLQV